MREKENLILNSVLSPQSSSPSHHLFVELTAELLERGACVRFQATGHSMYPVVKDGEIIKVEPVEPSHIRKGDIVLYRMKKGIIAHRVVHIEKRIGGPPFFVLRGDALETCDGTVEPRQVIGRVISVERNGRDYKLDSIHAKLFHTLRFYASSLRRRVFQIPLARKFYLYLKA